MLDKYIRVSLSKPLDGVIEEPTDDLVRDLGHALLKVIDGRRWCASGPVYESFTFRRLDDLHTIHVTFETDGSIKISATWQIQAILPTAPTLCYHCANHARS